MRARLDPDGVQLKPRARFVIFRHRVRAVLTERDRWREGFEEVLSKLILTRLIGKAVKDSGHTSRQSQEIILAICLPTGSILLFFFRECLLGGASIWCNYLFYLCVSERARPLLPPNT